MSWLPGLGRHRKRPCLAVDLSVHGQVRLRSAGIAQRGSAKEPFQALWKTGNYYLCGKEFHRMKGVEERWRQERDCLPSAKLPHPGSYWSPCQQPWCPALHYVFFWGSLGSGWLVTSERREALARPGSDSK